jgi:hypothetical protein
MNADRGEVSNTTDTKGKEEERSGTRRDADERGSGRGKKMRGRKRERKTKPQMNADERGSGRGFKHDGHEGERREEE